MTRNVPPVIMKRLQTAASRVRHASSTTTATTKRLRPQSAAPLISTIHNNGNPQSARAVTATDQDAWRTSMAALALTTAASVITAVAATAAHADRDGDARCATDDNHEQQHLSGGTGAHLNIHDVYEITSEIIGEGGYCVVHRGVDKRTGEAVAVKILGKRETPAREFWTEVDVLRTAGHHPNIMQLRGVFESDDCWYIVQELASEGELFDHLIENGAYSEQQASVAIRELCDALHYLHRKGIVHGDIKPENILLHNGRMCLVDFGVSFRVGEHFFADSQLTGTVAYAAPETLRHNNNNSNGNANANANASSATNSAPSSSNNTVAAVTAADYRLGPQADMFALGVVLYILLCGSHPFDPYNNLTDDEIRYRIVRGKFSRHTRAWQSISPPARDLIEKLLEKDPDSRLNSAEAMQHPWLANTAELSQEPIRNSAELLERFQRGRRRLRASILGVLLMNALDGDNEQEQAHGDGAKVPAPAGSVTMGVSSSAQVLSQKADALLSTLGIFDREKKGFITKNDLARVSKKLGRSLSETELNEMLVGATGDPEKTASSIKSIGYDDVKLAISSLRSASYDPGEVIIRQGHTGNTVFLLLDGEVEVSCKNPIKQAAAASEGDPKSGRPLPTGRQTTKTKATAKAKPKTLKKSAASSSGSQDDDGEQDVTLKRLEKGSFFGQIELLRPDGQLHPRIATYRCASSGTGEAAAASPCKVLQLVADDFLNVSDVYSTINDKVESSARMHTQEQLIKCVEASKHAVHKRALAAGEFVYHEGEECDSFFIILDGEVQVLRQREQVVVEELKAGDYFPLGVSGQTSNCALHTRHYSVRCTAPTKVIEIGGEAFRSFLHSNQFMASYFRQEIKTREQLRVDKHAAKAVVPPK